VRLLYLLMRYQLGRERIPAPAASGAAANGELVIGDTALRWLHTYEREGQVKEYAHVADLAALWDLRHRLPFVFARWVVRKDAPDSVRSNLERWLETFAGEEPALIERSVPKTALQLNLPDDFMRRYLKVIRRCLDPSDVAGQARFQSEWRALVADGRITWFPGEPGATDHRTHQHG
jgi:predicted solute-binding protein